MHCDVEQILEILEGRGDEAGAAHVKECSRCSGTLGELRWLTRALSDRLSWNRRRPTEDRVTDLQKLAAEIDSPSTPIGKIYADCRKSKEIRNDDPSLALELATRARNDVLSLFGRYDDETVRAALGLAQKERANALRLLGRYDDALSATRGARAVLEQGAAAEFDVATLDYIDATIHREVGRLDEALAAIARCLPVFEEYGEVQRVIHAKILRAAIYFSSGRIAEARDIFRELLPEVQDLEDAETEARLWTNLAASASALQDFDEAAVCLVQAREGWERTGARAESVRVEWSLANLICRRGDFGGAESRLRGIVDKFSGMKMIEDFTLAGLDLVEVLVIQGKAEQAERVLERAASEMALRPTPTRRRLLAAIQELARTKPIELAGIHTLREDFARAMPVAGPPVVFGPALQPPVN